LKIKTELPSDFRNYESSAQNIWELLNEETKQEIKTTFSKLLNERESYYKKHQKYHRVLRPTFVLFFKHF
jgi:hypothetical protein